MLQLSRICSFEVLDLTRMIPTIAYPLIRLNIAGADPSDSLMNRLPKTRRTMRKASKCEMAQGPVHLFDAVRDKATGRPLGRFRDPS